MSTISSIRLKLTQNDVEKTLEEASFEKAIMRTTHEKHDGFLVRLNTYNWNVDEHKIRAEIESELDAKVKQNEDELYALKSNPAKFKGIDVISLGLGLCIRNALHQGKVGYNESNIRRFSLGKTRNKIASSMFAEKSKAMREELAEGKEYIAKYMEATNRRNRILHALARLKKVEFTDILFTDNSLDGLIFSIESTKITRGVEEVLK